MSSFPSRLNFERVNISNERMVIPQVVLISACMR
jgi:hypothetical protein